MFLKLIYLTSFIFPSSAAKKAISLFLNPRKFKRPLSEKEWYESSTKRKLNCGFAINEWGSSSAQKILLVHGWEGRGAQLGAFAQPLVTEGYHVIALDGPAHGDSEGLQTNAGEFSRALISVQQELGHVSAIIAHSFGGGCSILALNLGLKCDQLITIASPSDYAQVVAGFLKLVRLSPYSVKYCYQLLSAKAQLKVNELNIAQIGSGLKIPVMIVHDELDKEVPISNAYELKQAWPESTFLKTQGLGHRRILKDSQVVDEIIQFIKKNS